MNKLIVNINVSVQRFGGSTEQIARRRVDVLETKYIYGVVGSELELIGKRLGDCIVSDMYIDDEIVLEITLAMIESTNSTGQMTVWEKQILDRFQGSSVASDNAELTVQANLRALWKKIYMTVCKMSRWQG